MLYRRAATTLLVHCGTPQQYTLMVERHASEEQHNEEHRNAGQLVGCQDVVKRAYLKAVNNCHDRQPHHRAIEGFSFHQGGFPHELEINTSEWEAHSNAGMQARDSTS